MRVLHIGKFYPPHPGGIERATADLCTALGARGVNASVIAHAPPGTHRNIRSTSDGVEVVLAACYGQFVYAPLSPGFPRLLARALREFKPDLLHLHVPNTSAFSALLLPAARRLPWLVHWHADVPMHARIRTLRAAYRVYRPLEQALLRRARAIVATSQPYLDSSIPLVPWRDKVRVIPLGIDEPRAAAEQNSLRWPTPGLRLLAVGRLSHYKGFDVLLHALRHVPQASLLLIGSGECADDLRILAQELGVDKRVDFAGFVPDDVLANAYASADVLCLPSLERSEAFGVVLLEAMRASVPVIASDIRGSGIGYVVRHGATGLLVPPGEPVALAAALTQLQDPALRQRMGNAGRQRWREEFTLNRTTERVLGLYRDVLRESLGKATPAA
jgi:glycosyltransferase involved in cell wall biosynthesis